MTLPPPVKGRRAGWPSRLNVLNPVRAQLPVMAHPSPHPRETERVHADELPTGGLIWSFQID